MIDEEKKDNSIDETSQQAVDLPKEIDYLPLDEQTQNIADQILATNDPNTIKDLTALFNLTQVKKNILKSIKLNNLMDKVEDQAIERFEKHPDEVSHKDLLGYMQVVQNQIDKTNQTINQIDQKPLIQINNTKQELNINTTLSQDSKENIRDAVSALLKLAQQNTEQQNIIDEAEEPCQEINENKV